MNLIYYRLLQGKRGRSFRKSPLIIGYGHYFRKPFALESKRGSGVLDVISSLSCSGPFSCFSVSTPSRDAVINNISKPKNRSSFFCSEVNSGEKAFGLNTLISITTECPSYCRSESKVNVCLSFDCVL